ncbi:MAG: hypothetical protein JW913_03295 [Chitinispirillaceae bacterium]|nr:hypothetical protein [Chitinispirillaceae bacterium]
MFTMTIGSIGKEENEASRDIYLEENGRPVTLSGELTLLAMKKGDTTDPFSLHHTVLVIDCDHDTDPHTLSETVETVLSKAVIHWNVIGLGAHDDNNVQPAIFRHLRPLSVIAAAKKAGVIPSSLLTFITALITILLLSIGIAGTIRSLIASEPVSSASFKQFLNGIAADRVFMVTAAAGILAGWAAFTFFHNKHLVRDESIRKSISDHIGTIQALKPESDIFMKNVKDSFLALGMPMAVVIDDPHQLDDFSHRILSNILSSQDHYTIGLMLWIIFKRDKNDPITDSISAAEKETGFWKNIISHHYCLAHPYKPLLQRKKAA